MHIVPILTVAVILTALLISPLSLFLQMSSFTLSLDLDSSEGDQAVQSLDVSHNQDVSISVPDDASSGFLQALLQGCFAPIHSSKRVRVWLRNISK